MVSVIIPDRNGQPYLQKTVNDLLQKAHGEIEIIVVEDGVFPDPPLEINKKVIEIYHGSPHNNVGMRDSINRGVAVSHGEYIMKTDEHTMFDDGFDEKLKADCEDNWVVIPRRKRLDPEEWKLIEDGRPPIDYMYIDYPYKKAFDKTQGLHGAEWKQKHYDNIDITIDDTPSMQGSCYFMKRSHWDNVIGQLDSDKYGSFTQEAQEIGFKTWLSGGRMIVNKNTWYAHFHKGKRGKGYGFSNEQYKRHMEGMEKGRQYCINYWLNTKDFLYDWEWFINKFPDMPGWEGDWKARLEADKYKDYANLPEDQRPDWYKNNPQV